MHKAIAIREGFVKGRGMNVMPRPYVHRSYYSQDNHISGALKDFKLTYGQKVDKSVQYNTI